MPKRLLKPLTRSVPELKISFQIDMRFTMLIGCRETPTGTDRRDRRTNQSRNAFHCSTHLGKMFKICARANMHMQARHRKLVPLRPSQTVCKILVPYSMFGLFAPRVGLLAVPMTKTWIYTKCNRLPRCTFTQLGNHIGRTAIDVDAFSNNKI